MFTLYLYIVHRISQNVQCVFKDCSAYNPKMFTAYLNIVHRISRNVQCVFKYCSAYIAKSSLCI